MGLDALADDGDPPRQRLTKTEAIRQTAECVQPDMGHYLVTARFHHHRSRAVSVHLGSALLCWVAAPSTSSSFPFQEGVFADAQQSTQTPA